MTVSMIGMAICFARKYQLYYAPDMFQNKAKVARAIEIFVPEGNEERKKGMKEESRVWARENDAGIWSH